VRRGFLSPRSIEGRNTGIVCFHNARSFSGFPYPCANSLYRRDRCGKSRAPLHRRGRISCVHLFHARWNIGTRKGAFFSFREARARKKSKKRERNIFRYASRSNSSNSKIAAKINSRHAIGMLDRLSSVRKCSSCGA